MIRGAIYRVELGEAKRGHEQRGRRFGLVLSPSALRWSTATIIPTSTSARASVFRPEIEFDGTKTLLLADQIRMVDTDYIIGDPVHYLIHDEMARVEHAVAHYLGF